ncbi:hypothetical protein, partial [Listeria monocytogenes]|uniref:hypothetical protein n=1 Tax=Listeria monocytogenes TaxID=1639 RepID=UPI002FDBEB2F
QAKSKVGFLEGLTKKSTLKEAFKPKNLFEGFKKTGEIATDLAKASLRVAPQVATKTYLSAKEGITGKRSEFKPTTKSEKFV